MDPIRLSFLPASSLMIDYGGLAVLLARVAAVWRGIHYFWQFALGF